MPDTRPITESFPWFAIRNRPVFSGQNALTTNKILTNDAGIELTNDGGKTLLGGDVVYLNQGDLYRYV